MGCAVLAAGGLLLAVDGGSRALFRDPEAARRIGARYLAHYLDDNVEPLAGILSRLAGKEDPAALRRYVADACRADFAAGNTVLVDGWVLSRSEAQACTLVALGAVT